MQLTFSNHPYSRRRGGHSPRAAYTLAEVVISSFVFSIAILAGHLGLVQGFHILGTVRENLRATQILDEKTEIIRLYTWEQITTNGFVPLTFTDSFYDSGQTNGNAGVTYYGTVSIANAPLTESYAADLKLVTVQLNWTNASSSHQRQMTTFVSRYGMHNYIYATK